jgi:hypothetical protein
LLGPLHQHIALRNAHLERVTIGLGQWLVEHGAWEVQPAMRTAELDVRYRQEAYWRSRRFPLRDYQFNG